MNKTKGKLTLDSHMGTTGGVAHGGGAGNVAGGSCCTHVMYGTVAPRTLMSAHTQHWHRLQTPHYTVSITMYEHSITTHCLLQNFLYVYSANLR